MKLVNESISDFLRGKSQGEIGDTLNEMLPRLLSEIGVKDVEGFRFGLDVPVRTTWLVYQLAPQKRQEILDDIARSAGKRFDDTRVEVEIDQENVYITVEDASLEGGRGKLELTLNGMGGPVTGDFNGEWGYMQESYFEDEDYTWENCWDHVFYL